MNFDDSLNAALRVLRRRPTEVLPPFLADSALTVVVQLSLVAGALGLFAVRGTARFRRLVEAILALEPPVTDAEAAAAEAALADFFTPAAVGVVLATVLVAAALGVLVRAAAGAAKVHAALAAMSDGRPCTAAVGGTLADTATFAWLTLLQLALFAGPILAGAAGYFLVGGTAGLAVLGLAVLLWVPVAIATYFLLLFVPEIVVVEGVGLWAAVRRNLGFLRANPGRAVVFGLLELGALFVVGGVGNAVATVGVGRITTLVSLFLAVPVLGLVKMGLYVDPGEAGVPTADPPAVDDRAADGADATGNGREWDDPDGVGVGGDVDAGNRSPEAVSPARPGPNATPGPAVGGRSVLSDLRSILARSVAELRAFVAERPGLVGVSLAAFFAGVAAGYAIGTQTGIDLVTERPTRDVFGAFPFDTAVDLAANNWQVAIGQAYAGVAFGVPVLGNLAFNGALVGGLAGLGFDPATFLALVVPHGVIEVPALAVGGAVGLFLAGRGWAVYRGRATADEGGTALRRGFLVLLGLAPVFLVAGFVEAFLTPPIAELLVG